MKSRPPPKVFSGEPNLSDPPKGIEITMAYNYYQENHSDKDAINFILHYLHERGLEKEATNVGKQKSFNNTASWVARLIDRGFKMPYDSIEYLNSEIKKVGEKNGSNSDQERCSPDYDGGDCEETKPEFPGCHSGSPGF